MYGFESWTIKKAKPWRTDAFKLWCWRRLLRGPWTAKRSNQSILKEINSEYLLKELLLKLNSNALATCCKELTHWKRPWCWERLKAKEEGETEDDMVGWHHWLNEHEFQPTPEIVEDRGTWPSAVHGVTKSWTWLCNWIATTRPRGSHFSKQHWLLLLENDI